MWSFGERARPFAGVDLLAQRTPPPFVVEIPANRFLNPAVEGLERAPSELTLKLGRVDGIAQIVPRPVRNEGDELFVWTTDEAQTIQKDANASHHVDIAALAANIVLLPNAAALNDDIESPRMVLDVEPVGEACERIDDPAPVADIDFSGPIVESVVDPRQGLEIAVGLRNKESSRATKGLCTSLDEIRTLLVTRRSQRNAWKTTPNI